jgi:hypothetical protein
MNLPFTSLMFYRKRRQSTGCFLRCTFFKYWTDAANCARNQLCRKHFNKTMVKVRSYDSHIHARTWNAICGTSIIELHGFWWIKYSKKPDKITVTVPVGEIPVRQVGIWYGYKLLNLSFGYFSKEDFTTFSNLGSTDFEDAFPIQEWLQEVLL